LFYKKLCLLKSNNFERLCACSVIFSKILTINKTISF
jgi:hypothetical protein